MAYPDHFIIIDDDSINNHICDKYIHIIVPQAEVTAFTRPVSALAYISETYSRKEIGETLVLLDINMPELTGWDVLDRFADFPVFIKRQFRIFILSSSVAQQDKDRAIYSPLIVGFLEKPLSLEQMKAAFRSENKAV